ncbi:hypothetical protein H920_05523 [Fukomys damarensis]|uniref:Uncharacterized protein n=1 Tax=Fukomys damarensis TaxID=885580 RepID=A0A091DPA5_FUKDA|nr:hypothetical protein H920_05523 [Fukomys damarensis]
MSHTSSAKVLESKAMSSMSPVSGLESTAMPDVVCIDDLHQKAQRLVVEARKPVPEGEGFVPPGRGTHIGARK